MLTMEDMLAFSEVSEDEVSARLVPGDGSLLELIGNHCLGADPAVHELILPLRPRVLVVEDDPLATRLMDRTIHSALPEIEVIATSSVDMAIEELRQRPPSLVISDYALEGKSTGLDLYVYCNRAYPDTPFLLVSGLAPVVEAELDKYRCVHPPFLRKPFKPADCMRIVQYLLQAPAA